MYRLTYVECLRPLRSQIRPRSEAPHFRIEPFASRRAALDRACEIIGSPTVSDIELHAESGEIVFDARALARELGWPLPPGGPVRWPAANAE
jgi:hypothetical protein